VGRQDINEKKVGFVTGFVHQVTEEKKICFEVLKGTFNFDIVDLRRKESQRELPEAFWATSEQSKAQYPLSEGKSQD